MTSTRTLVTATRSSLLALSLAMLAACGGGAGQNNGAAAAAPASPPAVPADASPVRAALAEFDAVCSRVMDRAGYAAAASAAGWQAFEVTPDSQLGQFSPWASGWGARCSPSQARPAISRSNTQPSARRRTAASFSWS